MSVITEEEEDLGLLAWGGIYVRGNPSYVRSHFLDSTLAIPKEFC